MGTGHLGGQLRPSSGEGPEDTSVRDLPTPYWKVRAIREEGSGVQPRQRIRGAVGNGGGG